VLLAGGKLCQAEAGGGGDQNKGETTKNRGQGVTVLVGAAVAGRKESHGFHWAQMLGLANGFLVRFF
jgi:hypothetical protein